MAVGSSAKQGTKEIRKIADDLQHCLSELIGPHSHKLIFMLISYLFHALYNLLPRTGSYMVSEKSFLVLSRTLC